MPGNYGKNCPGNGKHYDGNGKLIECECDECNNFLLCIDDNFRLVCTPITIIDVLFYNNFPTLFIISFLCSIKECAYRLSVTVGFLCPSISESVFTSIPHSNARVANVWRKE